MTRHGDTQRLAILMFILRYVAQHGYSPSFRDIQDGLNISSVAVVAHHMKAMKTQGLIQYDRGVARSIRAIN